MKKQKKIGFKFILLSLFAIALTGMLFVSALRNGSVDDSHAVKYVAFTKMLKNKEIEKVHIQNEETLMFKKQGDVTTYTTDNPQTATLKEELLQNGATVTKEETKESSFSWGSLFLNLLLIVVLVKLFTWFSNRKGGLGEGMSGMSSRMGEPNIDKKAENRLAKLEDVAGIDDAKDSIMEVVEYLRDPNQFEKMGIRLPKGVIFHGPPGTGKTLLARATAGEAGVNFIYRGGSEFKQMLVGVGAKSVRELFKEAREKAPCIIFIDEIDGLVAARTASSNSEDSSTLNQFLTEMDGFKDSKGIVVMAATNRLDMLDKAVLRPGRFDRQILVPNPDVDGRKAILAIHAKNKPIDSSLNFDRVAKMTSGFSGAELENLLNEAALTSLRLKKNTVTMEHVNEAYERIVIGPAGKRSASEHTIQVVTNHEAGHALVGHRLAKKGIERISVNPSGNYGGYVSFKQDEDSMKTKQMYYLDICTTLAGRAAEEIIFGAENVTGGAQQDFKQASQTAMQMVLLYGMGGKGPLIISQHDANMFDRMSESMKEEAYAEMKLLIEKAYEETLHFLKENKHLLVGLATHLRTNPTVDGELLEEILVHIEKGQSDLSAEPTVAITTLPEDYDVSVEGVPAQGVLALKQEKD